MLNDCINMFAVAFCQQQRTRITISPDNMTASTADLINMLTGTADISYMHNYAVIKPIKYYPSLWRLPIYNVGRSEILLYSGIAAQLGLLFCFENPTDEPTREEYRQMVDATRKTMLFYHEENRVTVCSCLGDINPDFTKCENIPEFTAGLLVGAAMSPEGDTAVSPLSLTKTKPYTTVLKILRENGAKISRETKKDRLIIHTIAKKRIPKRWQAYNKNKKA